MVLYIVLLLTMPTLAFAMQTDEQQAQKETPQPQQQMYPDPNSTAPKLATEIKLVKLPTYDEQKALNLQQLISQELALLQQKTKEEEQKRKQEQELIAQHQELKNLAFLARENDFDYYFNFRTHMLDTYKKQHGLTTIFFEDDFKNSGINLNQVEGMHIAHYLLNVKKTVLTDSQQQKLDEACKLYWQKTRDYQIKSYKFTSETTAFFQKIVEAYKKKSGNSTPFTKEQFCTTSLAKDLSYSMRLSHYYSTRGHDITQNNPELDAACKAFLDNVLENDYQELEKLRKEKDTYDAIKPHYEELLKKEKVRKDDRSINNLLCFFCFPLWACFKCAEDCGLTDDQPEPKGTTFGGIR